MKKFSWYVILVIACMTVASPAHSVSLTSALPGEAGIDDSADPGLTALDLTDETLTPESHGFFQENTLFLDDTRPDDSEPGLSSLPLEGPEFSSVPLEIAATGDFTTSLFVDGGLSGFSSPAVSQWDQPASFLASSVWTGGQEPWTAIPEPATIFLLGLGLLLFGRIQRFLRR